MLFLQMFYPPVLVLGKKKRTTEVILFFLPKYNVISDIIAMKFYGTKDIYFRAKFL